MTNCDCPAFIIHHHYFSTKSLTAIALAWLFDQGLIDYDARIAQYWPEVLFLVMVMMLMQMMMMLMVMMMLMLDYWLQVSADAADIMIG